MSESEIQIEVDVPETLEKLQSGYESIDAYKRWTREQESMFWARVYLWWREVRSHQSYLRAEYTKHNITSYATRGINFRPLLRLVTRDEISKSDLDIWASTLQIVHEDFEARPEHYLHDPNGAIAHFIKTEGGKTGVRLKWSLPDLDSEDDAELGLFELDDREFNPLFKTGYESYFADIVSPALQDPPPAFTDKDGYGVVLVKRDASGVVYLGSSSDSKLIRDLSMESYRGNLDAMPLTIRAVLEPLHILNVPFVIAKDEARFNELSRVSDKLSDKKNAKELSHRRLIYRPLQQSFLLSQTAVDASVVVHAEPKTQIINRADGDIFLQTSTRQSVETKLLNARRFNLYSTPDPEVFREVPPGFIASHTVKLENKLPLNVYADVLTGSLEAHISNYNHPSLSFIPFYESFGRSRWQVDFKPNSFSSVWQGKIGLRGLRDINARFLQQWIKSYGPKHKRSAHKILKLRFSTDMLTVVWEFTGTQFEIYKEFNVASGGLTDGGSGDFELYVLPRDFVFVMGQIAELNLLEDMFIAVAKHAIYLSFETAAAKYSCWIPACNEKGKRSYKNFQPYNPVTSIDPPPSEDPDDDPELEVGELGMIELEKAIQKKRR
jgi:hypothetical protein